MGKKHKSKARDIYRDLPPPLNKIMNELIADPNLKPKLLTRPGAQSPDVAALSGLLDIMNNPLITGAEVPRGTDPKAALKSHPDPVGAPGHDGQDGVAGISEPQGPVGYAAGAHVVTPNAAFVEVPITGQGMPQAPAPASNQKLYFTGRMFAGKDTTAQAAGCKIFGFAGPLYAIATYFFGREVSATVGKDLPGCRAFLQAVGQYGRGTLNEAYPMTPARAAFVELVRNLGTYENFGKHNVNWRDYGRNDSIWLDAALKSVEAHLVEFPEARVGITNCRFENERAALKAAGWQGWHCMTSAASWNARLLAAKLTPQSPQVLDMSERLAASLDAGVIKEISTRKTGQMLRVVWCDSTPPPSPRIHTVVSFLRLLNIAALAPHTITNDDF